MTAFSFARLRWLGAKAVRLGWACARFAARLLHPRDDINRALAKLNHVWEEETMRIVFSRVENPETAKAGRLLLGMLRVWNGRFESIRAVFANTPDAMMVRYALPEAVLALAGSDPHRAKALLRAGRDRWVEIGCRLSRPRRRSLVVVGAMLGDAESVAFYAADLRRSGRRRVADDLERKFAKQRRTARYMGVSADYASIRKAALVAPEARKRGFSPEARKRGLKPSRGTRAELVNALPSDFPLAVVTKGPVWLPVRGSFGQCMYPGHFDFPFPANVRPLFTSFHIANPDMLDDESLKYLRRFAPIGCRDLFTARLLRGAGVKAFVGSEGVVSGDAQKGLLSGDAQKVIPQSVLDAIAEGQGEAKIYALWRKVAAPAMARTDAMIAEQNAKYPLPKVRLEDLGLSRVPVQSFGDASGEADGVVSRDAQNVPVHLLFGFDDRHAEFFPGTFEGVWRHSSRPLVAHIFGRGLSAAMFEQWAALFKGVRFIHHDLSGVALGDARLEDHITVSSWDRLLAPALLPDVEKIVWLDTDILVRKDVSRLFDTQLGDAPLAARGISGANKIGLQQVHRYDGHDRFTERKRETLRNVFFSGATVFNGFNAGITVMNLAKMRRERMMEKTLPLVKACGVGDQLILNLVARGRWTPLADEWNHFPPVEIWEDPALVHYIGAVKPWHDTPLPFRREWLENAERARARLAA